MYSGNVSCIRAMPHVFGQCLMFSGINVSCIWAMSHVFGLIGQCLVCSGNVSCIWAMRYVFGQCLMLLGNVLCIRAISRGGKQSRTQSNACSRVRVGIGSGETESICVRFLTHRLSY